MQSGWNGVNFYFYKKLILQHNNPFRAEVQTAAEHAGEQVQAQAQRRAKCPRAVQQQDQLHRSQCAIRSFMLIALRQSTKLALAKVEGKERNKDREREKAREDGEGE